jgi:hypothetical protein
MTRSAGAVVWIVRGDLASLAKISWNQIAEWIRQLALLKEAVNQ